MYAVKFQTTDCPSMDGYLVSRNGDWHWIINEPEGWVWATSSTASSQGVNADVKVFATRNEAVDACDVWKESYHPWYGKPNGIYEIVELEPTYSTKQTGWKVK